MKRCIAVVMGALLFSSMLYAADYHTDAGSILVSGNFTFQKINGGGSAYGSNPSLSFFIAPGLSVGYKFTLSRTSADGLVSRGWGRGPSISYYFRSQNAPEKTLKDTFYPFPYVTLSYICTNENVSHEGDKLMDSETYLMNFGIGLLVMIDDKVGMNLEAAHDFGKQKIGLSDFSSKGTRNSYYGFLGIQVFLY